MSGLYYRNLCKFGFCKFKTSSLKIFSCDPSAPFNRMVYWSYGNRLFAISIARHSVLDRRCGVLYFCLIFHVDYALLVALSVALKLIPFWAFIGAIPAFISH
jgi:hypothetical protein